MTALVSLTAHGFRRTFLAFYALSFLLPLLILLFVVVQYVYPRLTPAQVEALRDAFTYGLVAMVSIPFLSFFLMLGWVKVMEGVTTEVKHRAAEMIETSGEVREDGDENEMLALRHLFDTLQRELQDKIAQLNHVSSQLIESNVKLSEMAITDELTTLYNRRYFECRLSDEIHRAERSKDALALIMIDLDGFKAYNDTYGHQAGDRVLRDVGLLIRKCVRKSDIPFRYGGDEFAIILPECTVENGKRIAKKLARAVADHSIEFEGQTLPGITISCGVAGYTLGLENFIALADKCLYHAKSSGRGRVAAVRARAAGAA